MTAVEFHVNQADKLHYTCRLLRKVYRSGTRAVVTAEPELLAQLDQQLWLLSPTEFVPHCGDKAVGQTLAVTPILLSGQLEGCPADGVLINLGRNIAVGFERFERVIEVASDLEEDRLAARARWKYYQERGYALKRHDVAPADQKAA